MQCRIGDLRYKEVINVTGGERLGYVSDAEIDTHNGRILALIVPGPCRFFGLFGRGDDYVLPWECIDRIGEDLILIHVSGPHQRACRSRRKRPGS